VLVEEFIRLDPLWDETTKYVLDRVKAGGYRFSRRHNVCSGAMMHGRLMPRASVLRPARPSDEAFQDGSLNPRSFLLW